MTKLNDLQLILLAAAAQREDGSLLPPPDHLTDQAARIRKVIPPLIKQGLVEEASTTDHVKSWREDGDVSADLLRRLLGHALQEKAMGGLSSAQRQALRRLGTGQSDNSLKAGTRLIRKWNNRTIAVNVEEDGFMWEERSYRSLSAIAREVTGTAWSGPRFFGLRDNG